MYSYTMNYIETVDNLVIWILESDQPTKIEPAQTLRLFDSLRMSENYWNVDVMCIEIVIGSSICLRTSSDHEL